MEYSCDYCNFNEPLKDLEQREDEHGDLLICKDCKEVLEDQEFRKQELNFFIDDCVSGLLKDLIKDKKLCLEQPEVLAEKIHALLPSKEQLAEGIRSYFFEY